MAQWKLIAYDENLNRMTIPNSDSYLADRDLEVDANFTLTGTFNGYDMSVELPKISLITITGAIDLDALKAKGDFLTVTQAVDLDVMEARLNELDAAVVLKGAWDASTLLFPTSTNAGESWICSVAGSVAGVDFAVGDRVVALVDGAPNSVYTGNWLKLDYTDKVSSVAGRTGNVVLTESDITDLQSYLLPTDIDSIAKLNVLVGGTVLTAAQIDSLTELNALFGDGSVLIDTTDPRLSDARAPTTHSHSFTDLNSFPQAKSYTFASRTASSGSYYLGGFYEAPAADANLSNASPTILLGTANHPYAAHAFMVFGAGSTNGTNITITVTGTSYDELTGIRTAADSEVVYNGTVAGLTLNDYLETTKKWIGQVTYTLTSDGGVFTCDFNYGFAKYEDFANQDFTIDNFEMTGLFNAADSGFDIEVLHHKTAGWTYHTTAFVPGTTALERFTDEYSTESDPAAGEHIAWKRTNLSQVVAGASMEGILCRITTTVNNSISYLNGHVGVLVNVP